MPDKLLININHFKDEVNLSRNFDNGRVKKAIKMAQLRNVRDTICNDLYDDLLSRFPDSLTADDNNLLAEIRPFLIQAAYERITTTASIKNTAAGNIVFTGGENAEQADASDKAILLRQTESDKQFFQAKLLAFLERNKDIYPLFEECCDPIPQTIFDLSAFNRQSIQLRRDRFHRNGHRFNCHCHACQNFHC